MDALFTQCSGCKTKYPDAAFSLQQKECNVIATVITYNRLKFEQFDIEKDGSILCTDADGFHTKSLEIIRQVAATAEGALVIPMLGCLEIYGQDIIFLCHHFCASDSKRIRLWLADYGIMAHWTQQNFFVEHIWNQINRWRETVLLSMEGA